MIAEVEEKDVFEAADFDELAELKALARSLKRADGFSLLFARCNQRPKQIELQKKVIADIPEKNIQVIYFEKAIENLVDELRTRLDGEQPDAVFVYGLESSMPRADEAYKTPFVLNLNASRNSFPLVADCPVVFWLPDYGIRAIMNGAPDFFSVRSGIFFFENDAEILSQQIFEAISIHNSEQDALLLEERKQRLENLKQLLADYQSLPEDKRNFEMENKLKDKLADFYYYSANYQEAEKLRNELIQSVKTKDKSEYANQLNDLALIYQSQGKYDKAIKIYKQALRIGEKTIGKEHSNYATRLHNLASTYSLQYKHDEAIKIYKQALQIDEKTIGKEHPSYAIGLNNLASAYRSQGKYDEAIKLLKQALQIDEKIIGKEHPSYANRLVNLANVYQSQGIYEQAIKSYNIAFQIYERTIGKEHPNYAIGLSNLALVYRLQGRYDEAIKFYKQALQIFRLLFDENHPSAQIVIENLRICSEELSKQNSSKDKK